jgi:VIT1/CCC1 family predicted Fe2+/Mn2+ transporter
MTDSRHPALIRVVISNYRQDFFDPGYISVTCFEGLVMPSRHHSDETIAHSPAEVTGMFQESVLNMPLTKEEQNNKEVEYFRLLMQTAGRRSQALQDGIIEEIHLLQKNGELGSAIA